MPPGTGLGGGCGGEGGAPGGLQAPQNTRVLIIKHCGSTLSSWHARFTGAGGSLAWPAVVVMWHTGGEGSLVKLPSHVTRHGMPDTTRRQGGGCSHAPGGWRGGLGWRRHPDGRALGVDEDVGAVLATGQRRQNKGGLVSNGGRTRSQLGAWCCAAAAAAAAARQRRQ